MLWKTLFALSCTTLAIAIETPIQAMMLPSPVIKTELSSSPNRPNPEVQNSQVPIASPQARQETEQDVRPPRE